MTHYMFGSRLDAQLYYSPFGFRLDTHIYVWFQIVDAHMFGSRLNAQLCCGPFGFRSTYVKWRMAIKHGHKGNLMHCAAIACIAVYRRKWLILYIRQHYQSMCIYILIEEDEFDGWIILYCVYIWMYVCREIMTVRTYMWKLNQFRFLNIISVGKHAYLL